MMSHGCVTRVQECVQYVCVQVLAVCILLCAVSQRHKSRVVSGVSSALRLAKGNMEFKNMNLKTESYEFSIIKKKNTCVHNF